MTSDRTIWLQGSSGERIPVFLKFSDRKTLAISVCPDMRVEAVAPHEADLDLIRQKLRKRLPWIRKQRWFFASLLPHLAPRRYVPGETHYYLGRQYRLKIGTCGDPAVKLRGGYLEVTVSHVSNGTNVEPQLNQWYRERARAYFERKIEEFLPKLTHLSVVSPKVTIRKMKTRWGSCTANGHLLLNPDLIMTPSHCVEYVVAHELCHLVHPNHGDLFRQLLVSLVPDWELRKRRLDAFPSA